MKSKVLIATIPGMIEEQDWKTLSEKADVEYLEKNSISQDELLKAMSDKEYVMLNFDIIKKLDE